MDLRVDDLHGVPPAGDTRARFVQLESAGRIVPGEASIASARECGEVEPRAVPPPHIPLYQASRASMEPLMVETNDKVFAGSVPEIYDRLMVPLIFEPYALDLAGRIVALAPRDVLETAAGTGVLTRALAARLAPGTRMVATDLNQAMIDQAAR